MIVLEGHQDGRRAGRHDLVRGVVRLEPIDEAVDASRPPRERLQQGIPLDAGKRADNSAPAGYQLLDLGLSAKVNFNESLPSVLSDNRKLLGREAVFEGAYSYIGLTAAKEAQDVTNPTPRRTQKSPKKVTAGAV